MTTSIVETFNTHRMTDEVVRELACGRDDEMAEIMPAIHAAAAHPHEPPQALIIYGERGSGKSFLMRMLQIECADIDGLVCVLLPEEQYNLRAPQQLLNAVTASIRGQDWAAVAWKMDTLSLEESWNQALQDFHAALDERFGPGRGMAVVLLENFDLLAEKLFGAKYMPKSVRGSALERRQAEERLRKLMSARAGRFMLVASATGTVDMEYERPLFKAFKPVDIHSWTSKTAVEYFNKRRQLAAQPPLSDVEYARARAITEFIGGNPRLAQLLSTVLALPSAKTIAQTLDALVDHLADYYRQRLDSLPPAAAGLLDAMIRGGEPVSQTALGHRVGGEQRNIAAAFSFLTRSRIVQAARRAGGAAQLYQIRDRLFVHFYRRRYGNSQGLAAIAELLESFYTTEEREQQIMEYLERGEFDDARAFGPLPLQAPAADYGFNPFRDVGIVDGSAGEWFVLAGVAAAEIPAARQHIRDRPADACKEWEKQIHLATTPTQAVAASTLSAIAASRCDLNRIAQRQLDTSMDAARASGDADALIFALSAAAIFSWACMHAEAGGERLSLDYLREAGALASQAQHPAARGDTAWAASFVACHEERFKDALTIAQTGLQFNWRRMSLLYTIARSQIALDLYSQSLETCDELLTEACTLDSLDRQIDALVLRSHTLSLMFDYDGALRANEEALALSIKLGDKRRQVELVNAVGWKQYVAGNHNAAYLTATQTEAFALTLDPPLWGIAADAVLLKMTHLGESSNKQDRKAFSHQLTQSIQRTIEYATKATDKPIFDALVRQWVRLGSRREAPDVIDLIKHALAFNPDLDAPSRADWPVFQDWLKVAVKANAWPKALEVAREHPEFANRMTSQAWQHTIANMVLSWTEAAQSEGRAAAYLLASNALPFLKAFWNLRPQSEENFLTSMFATLTSALARRCSDPGLLRDLAALLRSTFGDVAQTAVDQIETFAAFNEADDVEQFLQDLDPDLAAAVRLILPLSPAPRDTLAKRGRREGR